MNIIKRSGEEVEFDITKIISAVNKANKEVISQDRLSIGQIQKIANNVEDICHKAIRAMSVEEIQDAVENQIMQEQAFQVARVYITYRLIRQTARLLQ